VAAALAACGLGVLYALVSAYWGAGGTRLLETVGGALERAGRAHDAALLAVVWITVVVKLAVAAAGLVAVGIPGDARWHRGARLVSWSAAVVLVGYGGVLTAAGLLVQAGVIRASAHADFTALRWHTYLWDPWFLLWGVLLATALWRSRPRSAHRPGHRTNTPGAGR
jgi:hypothetical protein